MKIVITGQAGFVGTHLYNLLGLDSEKYERVPFEDSYFDNEEKLREAVRNCHVIVHLAAMNRHEDPQVIYDMNIELVQKLTDAMDAENVTPHILFSSSMQETLDNLYGKSKKKGREMLEEWAAKRGASFTGLVVPNVFGEFSRPNYNTFIATFASKLINGEQPTIMVDSEVSLIYVGSLCQFVMSQFENKGIQCIKVPCDFEKKVTEILALFEIFNELYHQNGFIPELKDRNEINLFNTFASYIPPRCVKLTQYTDTRGSFVETVKLGVGGQVSFSTTVPGITRGNHFHTRKIERFVVIKGKARIQLRKIDSDEILNFYLDGTEPAYVDMPIWYTHNITNIGDEDLYTQFWINEWYDPTDGDTFFEPCDKNENYKVQ